MLVRREADHALAIGQLSHSWLAGQLARAWGNESFGRVGRLEEIALGAQQHDIGWNEPDLRPRLNRETGLPETFVEASVETHLEVWREAPDRLLTQSAYAALAVSLHGAYLSGLRAKAAPEQAAALQAHIEQERARQRSLGDALGVGSEERDRIQRQMLTWDRISLALCHRWQPFTIDGAPSAEGVVDIELVERADGVWTLDPWPFASRHVDVRCEARQLHIRYEDEATLQQDFAGAMPRTLAFELIPA